MGPGVGDTLQIPWNSEMVMMMMMMMMTIFLIMEIIIFQFLTLSFNYFITSMRFAPFFFIQIAPQTAVLKVRRGARARRCKGIADIAHASERWFAFGNMCPPTSLPVARERDKSFFPCTVRG